MEWKWRIETNAMKQTKRMLKGLARFAAIGLALATGSAKATEYEIIKLGPPHIGGRSITLAHDISEDNEIVGFYDIAESYRAPIFKKPFLYKDGIYYELITDFPGNFNGSAIAINNSQNMVFHHETLTVNGSTSWPAYSWDYDESYEADNRFHYGKSILDVDPTGFRATCINQNGTIAGVDFIYSWRGNIELCTDCNDFYHSFSINDYDTIVGTIFTQSIPQFPEERYFGGTPFKWKDGEITNLPIIDGWDYGFAVGVNNRDQIVGGLIDFLYPKTGAKREYAVENTAVMWEYGNIQELPLLTKAFSINDLGVVVGSINQEAAVLDNGEITNLNDFIDPSLNGDEDWDVLRFATKINNNGWVIGHGWLNGDTGTTPDHRTSYGFLAKPIKIDLRVDFDDNGIVDGGDFATFADQWLLEDDRYVPITILEEGFERMPVDLPYPWDVNDPNGPFESPYVGAVYTVDFPEHDREFLEDKVLCLQNTNTQYTISCKSHSYRVEYDFLVNDPDGGCSNLNTTMDPTYSEGRSSSFHLFAEMGCDQFIRDRDGIFWYGDSTEFKITELIPNTWYHVDRTIDVLNRTEEINILNIDTEEEYNYSSPPLYSYDGVGSLGFFTYSDPSNYVLLDNLRIEATQTQE